MTNRRNPFDSFFNYPPYDRDNSPWKNPYKQVDDIASELRKVLNDILNNGEAKTKMNKLNKRSTLRANVKRGNKVFRITIENITPKPSEMPDEIEIEWDPDNAENPNGSHEDLTE